MPHAQNLLLTKLPARDLARLLSVALAIQCLPGQVLAHPSEPVARVLFPWPGLVAAMGGCSPLSGPALALVGGEGMLGATRLLGVRSAPWQIGVLAAGSAWQLPRREFEHLLTRSPAMRRLVGRYLCVQLAQLSAAGSCMGTHRVRGRLASCLLQAAERWVGGPLALTHEVVALLLGVRRASVTLAAGELQEMGLIAYHRGQVEIRDPPGLQRAACACYGLGRRVYGELLGAR